MNAIQWLERLENIIVDAEMTTNHKLVEAIADSYHRFNYTTKVDLYETN